MKTEFEFLSVLDRDLEEAAARETARARDMDTNRRRRHLGPTWMRVAAAVIAFLVIAGGVGLFVERRGNRSFSAAAPAVHAPNTIPEPPQFLGIVPQPNHRGVRSTGGEFFPAFRAPGVIGGTSDSSVQQANASQTDLSKIVRTGSISIQIPDNTFAQKSLAIAKVAGDARGIVLDSSTQNQRTGTFTLKVPAGNFQSAMAALAALGVVQSSQQNGKDVTSQYVDYTARLQILKGRRVVVLRLMSKATSISDTLYLQNQFDSVQLQIEQIQGNLNVLRNQVSESTITVDMAEKDSPKVSTSGVRTPSLTKAIRLAWQGSLRVIEAILVGLGYLIPIALVALGIFALTRGARRRRAASSTP
jgi:hypothetical protein